MRIITYAALIWINKTIVHIFVQNSSRYAQGIRWDPSTFIVDIESCWISLHFFKFWCAYLHSDTKAEAVNWIWVVWYHRSLVLFGFVCGYHSGFIDNVNSREWITEWNGHKWKHFIAGLGCSDIYNIYIYIYICLKRNVSKSFHHVFFAICLSIRIAFFVNSWVILFPEKNSICDLDKSFCPFIFNVYRTNICYRC